MNAEGETCLFIELIVSSLIIISLFSNRPQENILGEFLFKFLIASLIVDC